MERRRSKRIAVNVDVQISVMDDVPGSVLQADPADDKIERVVFATEGAGEFFDAQMVDLSVNGARLMSETQPPLLSRVSLAFSFGELRHVHATALVMWRTTVPSSQGQYSFGVLFEAMPVDVRVGIHKAVTA
jgi:hypothetical protein